MARLLILVLLLAAHGNEVGTAALEKNSTLLGEVLRGSSKATPHLNFLRPRPSRAAEGIPLQRWGRQEPYSGSENDIGSGHIIRHWGNREELGTHDKQFKPWSKHGILGDLNVPSTKDVLEPSDEALTRAALIGVAFVLCLAFCVSIPRIIMPLVYNMDSKKFGGIKNRTLMELVWYRWNTWLASPTFTWQILAIFFLILMAIGCTANVIMSGSSNLGEALLMAFVFVSASSQRLNAGSAEMLSGTLCTTAGLFLLAVLLSIFVGLFKGIVEAAQDGTEPVVEGNHVVILGFSDSTPALLEELALADEKATLAVMALQPKDQVDQHTRNVDMRNARLAVRSGNWCGAPAMRHVGANTARCIIIPEDPSVCRASSDSQTIAALLTLRSEEWPLNGHVVAQCSLARNEQLMDSIHPGKTLIISGDKLGAMLVQSAQDQGLCNIFEQIIGFEGDEFYWCDAGEHDLEGLTFGQLPFHFPEAVPVGIVDISDSCLLNPDKRRVIRHGDRIIVLAEDADSFSATEEPYFGYPEWKATRPSARFREERPNDFAKTRTLVCNFNDRGVGRSILFALDSMMGEGSQVDIYTGVPEEECKRAIESAQEQEGHAFKNIATTILHVPYANMASAHELEKLPISGYDHIFVLADGPDGTTADRRSIAMILQMQSMATGSEIRKFDPVVQVSSKTTVAQLEMCGVSNYIDTNLILSRCLAMVGMNQASYGVLSDLLGAGGNSFDIQDLRDYLPEGESLPICISFAEATALVNHAAQQVLIGWSSTTPSTKRCWNLSDSTNNLLRQWVINPKDKLKTRPWRHHDRVVVIKLVPNAGEEPAMTDEMRMNRRKTITNTQYSPKGTASNPLTDTVMRRATVA